MVLKLISRSLGKFLISISVTVFILTFLAIGLADNTDALKSSFDSEQLLQIALEDSDITIEEAKELCKQNPEQENCDLIEDPSKIMGEQLDPLLDKLEGYKQDILNARFLSMGAFILGLIFLFLGTSSIILTLYKASFTTALSSAFYIIFYKFLSGSVPSIAEEVSAQQDVPQELLEIAINAVTTWLELPIQEVVSISIILLVISLPIAIIFFILKRKYPQEKTETSISANKNPSKK
tara:strand:+ start:1233 stop:1943 length:711 start_codon:yes stop_codon:yes gene_type:complete